MFWLARPPYLRWAAAALLVGTTLWVELAPAPGVPLTFLTGDVAAGTPLDPGMVETRFVPDPGFETVAPEGSAAIDLRAGDPLLGSHVSEIGIPTDWVVIAAPVPRHATPGAMATGVILADSAASATSEFPALVVATPPEDSFDASSGTLALPAEWLAPVASAISAGRLVVATDPG